MRDCFESFVGEKCPLCPLLLFSHNTEATLEPGNNRRPPPPPTCKVSVHANTYKKTLANLPTGINKVSFQNKAVNPNPKRGELILFLLIHSQHTGQRPLNWVYLVVNKRKSISPMDELILWVSDNSESSWNTETITMWCWTVQSEATSFNQTQQFRWVLIMVDYWLLLASWKILYQLRCEPQVGRVSVTSTLEWRRQVIMSNIYLKKPA